jgi:hypothetical protein
MYQCVQLRIIIPSCFFQRLTLFLMILLIKQYVWRCISMVNFNSVATVHSYSIDCGAVEEVNGAPKELCLYSDLIMLSCYLCRNYNNSGNHPAAVKLALNSTELPEQGDISLWIKNTVFVDDPKLLHLTALNRLNEYERRNERGDYKWPGNVNLQRFETPAKIRFELSLKHTGLKFSFLLKAVGFPVFGSINKEMVDRAAIAAWLLLWHFSIKYSEEEASWFRKVAFYAGQIYMSGAHAAFAPMAQDTTAAHILAKSVPVAAINSWTKRLY